MATIQEILDKINASKSKSKNINNNSFIDLMRQISGNPEDAVAPVNDANSIYGHIVQMYTELFDGSTNYEEIVANIDAIRDVFNNLEIINSLNDIKAALESIFADKSTLDSIFADKLILDSLYTDKSTFDSLFADKIKFDRIYGSIDNIDRVYKSIDNIDTVIESAANIDILANDIQSVIATAVIDAEVVIVANSAPEIITLADNINTLNEIYTNRDEIYAADENAVIATTKAIEASNSATIATTKASEASASALSASTASNTSTTKATESAASAVLANTSAGSANTSAASASSNATIATTKASEASVSASNASTSATNASTSASAASVSASTSATKATEAATSASTALGYKNDVSTMKLAIETIYDTFDDRFLGTKTTNPLVDNDGNALLDGAIYFDTTTNAMKVYDVGTTTWYTMPQIYLNSLLDVELTSLTTGNILVWNGTKWINYTLSKADVGLNNVENTADNTKNVLSATKLTTARTIGGVSFDGTSNINLPGVNATGNQSTTGNAATATKLAATKTINGVAFDGSANITVADSTKVAKTSDTGSAKLPVGTTAQRDAVPVEGMIRYNSTVGSPEVYRAGVWDALLTDAGEYALTTYVDSTADTLVDYITSVNKKRRNYLINGNFQFWDYATSQTSAGYGSDNRWHNSNNGSTKTHSRITSGDTERALFESPYYSRTVVNSVAGASSEVRKIQRIEDITKLAGKTATLSFWAKADSAKNIAVELNQAFGTGGSPSTSYTNGGQLISLTTIWKKYSVTITLPSIVGKTLGTDGVHTTSTSIFFWFDAGSNFNSRTNNLGQQSGTFDIAEVKLEDGSVATDGWAPYDGEWGSEAIARMRYYEVSSLYGGGYSPSTAATIRAGCLYFTVVKRTKPSIVTTNPVYFNCSSLWLENITTHKVGYYTTSANTNLFWVNADVAASAEIG